MVDENGVPLAKLVVYLQGTSSRYAETVTDAEGRFRFEGVVQEPLNLASLDHNGVMVQQRVTGTDKEVILVRKSSLRK